MLQIPHFKNKLLCETPITVLDVETTGTSPKYGDRIIEIAMLQMCGSDVVAHVDTLLDPQRSLKSGAMTVNGITPDMVMGQPTFAEMLPEVHSLLAESVVVGHNVQFDLNFLQAEYAIAQSSFPSVVALDTLAIARKRYRFPSNSLPNVAAQLGICGDQFHRAMSDVLVTYEIFTTFASDQGFESVQDWLDVQGGNAWKPRRIEIETQTSRPKSAPAPIDLPIPELIEVALSERRLMQIEYVDSRYGTTQRTIRVSSFDGRTICAFCHLREEPRRFVLERISSASLL